MSRSIHAVLNEAHVPFPERAHHAHLPSAGSIGGGLTTTCTNYTQTDVSNFCQLYIIPSTLVTTYNYTTCCIGSYCNNANNNYYGTASVPATANVYKGMGELVPLR